MNALRQGERRRKQKIRERPSGRPFRQCDRTSRDFSRGMKSRFTKPAVRNAANSSAFAFVFAPNHRQSF